MPKIHELLAVEASLATSADQTRNDTIKVFTSKQGLFSGLTKVHQLFDDEQQHLVQAPETKAVETTVQHELDFVAKHAAPYLDVMLQKEAANQKAVADIIIDGTVIAKNVPSIVLLSLEKKLQQLMPLYTAIPTLDSSKLWAIDPAYTIPNVYRTVNPEERQQTQTIKDFQTVAPATDKHPAQVVQVEKTTQIGKYVITGFTGALTSSEKSAKIERLTQLIRAVKAARQRANEQEIDPTLRIGKALFDYING